MGCNQDEDVAIFWDYENCHPPSHLSGYEIVQKLRHVGHKFGTIKQFKAYFELMDPVAFSKTLNLRSELQCSGVSLTDCPHNGRKDVADKMIMVDMLAYAIDNPAPSTIILISGDRDFAYAVSILRLRRYRVVIVSQSGIHASLKAQASVFVDWTTDILGIEVNEESVNFRANQELRTAPLSPVKSKALNLRKNPPQVTQNSQWTIEEDEGDIMTHLATARSRKPKQIPSMPAPIPITPRTPASNFPESLPSTAEDDSDGFSYPSRSPSRTESAPAALGADVRCASAPSTLVDSTDYGTTAQASPIVTPKQVLSEPKVAPATAVGSPPQKPPPKLDNAAVPSSTGSTISVATESPLDTAKAVGSVALNTTGVKPTQTTVVQSTSSMVVIAASQTKVETVPALATPNSDSGQLLLNKFRLLIERLEIHRTKGAVRPLRSTIAVELATRDNDVYRRAGVQRFSQYSALAEKEGVIELGGREGGAWISLTPAWVGAKLS